MISGVQAVAARTALPYDKVANLALNTAEKKQVDAALRGTLAAMAGRELELRRQPDGYAARHRLDNDVAGPVLDAGGLIHPRRLPLGAPSGASVSRLTDLCLP